MYPKIKGSVATILLAVLLFGFTYNVKATSPEFYRKHVIIVVDQTPKTSAGGYLQPIGNRLLSIFLGKDKSESFDIDLSKDLVEVFLYGMEGQVNKPPFSGTAYDVFLTAENGASNDVLFDKTIKGLVHPYVSVTNINSLNSWWKKELYKVFATQTKLGKTIANTNGYGFSAFLPMAAIPFIDTTVPAQEYYIISISTFQAGMSGENASFDIGILGQIYKNDSRAKRFYEWVAKYQEPYVLSDFLNISEGAAENHGVSAIGKQLTIKSAAKTSVYVTSNISLEQKEYGKNVYTINPITISFPKDENLDIDNIKLYIKNEELGNIYSQILSDCKYDDVKKEYCIPGMTIELPDDLDMDSNMEFSFVFYPHIESKSKVLPYVFVANRNISRNDISFVFASEETYTDVVIVVFVLVIFVSIVLFILYKRNARNAKVIVEDLTIERVSQERFMDVTNNKVVNYDCWYFHPIHRNEARIRVTGCVLPKCSKLSPKQDIVVEYRVVDDDNNKEFSFRPDGRRGDGTPFQGGDNWIQAPLMNNKYEFDVIAYSCVSNPDFTKEDINEYVLKLKVVVRAYFRPYGKVDDRPQFEKKYSFIVREEFSDGDNRDVWVAFDPGTSGSSIAYGQAALPSETRNINLAYNHYIESGKDVNSPIFYSKIQIPDNSGIFNEKLKKVEEFTLYNEDTNIGDFRFGNAAHINFGRNSFQSIKKLLGYANTLKIENHNNIVREIRGEDLAHLIIKGLCSEFESYLISNKNVDVSVRNKLVPNGHLAPSRAIVVVPNNYAVNKVQAMVDTIKRTESFKEIHYIFEAEGALMYYLNNNWKDLDAQSNKTFVVFDMGGATINATSFRLDVFTGNQNGNRFIERISVDTISRVGYTVGGDTIDFALIKIILGIPSVKRVIGDVESFMRRHKKRLIEYAQKLKIDYIEASVGKPTEGNCAVNIENFWIQLKAVIDKCLSDNQPKVTLPNNPAEDDSKYLWSPDVKNVMDEFVFNCIDDAVQELITEDFTDEIVLILSGRSTLYPGVNKTVKNALQEYGNWSRVNLWDYNGDSNKEETVKTAVVRGACWYAINSRYVELRHDSVTSTFGYIDQLDCKATFIPLIEKNQEFDNGEYESERVAPKDPTINTVSLIQMLGSNYDDIYDKPELKHKMVRLAEILPAQMNYGTINSIKVKVDSNNNFSYEINVNGMAHPLTGTCPATEADIVDSNSEAYVFAALPTYDEAYESDNIRRVKISANECNDEKVQDPQTDDKKLNKKTNRF